MSDLNQSQRLISRAVLEATNGTLHGPQQLVDAFYPELRRLAAAKMRKQPSSHTWRPTELVSELYLELVKINALRPVKSKDQRERSAFFALAGQAMHWLLVRHTRRLSWKAEREELPASLADAAPGADQLAELDDLLETRVDRSPTAPRCGTASFRRPFNRRVRRARGQLGEHRNPKLAIRQTLAAKPSVAR